MSAPVWHTADQSITANNPSNAAAPDNISEGDLLVAFVVTRDCDPDAEDTGITPPSGWDLAHAAFSDEDTGRPEAAVFWKIAGGSEPSTYSFTGNSTTRILIGRVTGHEPSNPIGPATGVADVDESGVVAIPEVVTTLDDSLLVSGLVVRIGNLNIQSVPSGMSQVAFLFQSTNAPRAAFAVGDLATAGGSGTKTWEFGPANFRNAAVLIAINPPHEFGVAVHDTDPNSGPMSGGTDCTITGQAFEEGATVHFGEHEATDVVVVNSTTITCKTPAADGS